MLNTTVSIIFTELHNTFTLKLQTFQASSPTQDLPLSTHHPFTIIMRGTKAVTAAETIVKAWAELLVELLEYHLLDMVWEDSIDMKVSVKLWDSQDMRAKKTFTDQPTTIKSALNWREAQEVLAQNIYKNLLLLQISCLKKKFKTFNKYKNIKEVYKRCTVKEDDNSHNMNNTKPIQHLDIDSINNRPESYQHFTKG